MFRAADSPLLRRAFVRAVLNQFANRASSRRLESLVREAFGLDALEAERAVGMIRGWRSGLLYIP